MRSDYSSTRTYCLENLDTIALALGPAKAKGLLGGFISNLLKDQDEGGNNITIIHSWGRSWRNAGDVNATAEST